MSDLFNFNAPPDRAQQRYPNAPGHRGVDTSVEAATAIAPCLKGLQARALREIRASGRLGLTSQELADHIGVDRTAIQPRTTELKLLGLIRDSGQRRPNRTSGKNAIVWITSAPANDHNEEAAA